MSAISSRPGGINPSIADTVYIWGPDLIITVSADVQAPSGAEASAKTLLTTTLWYFIFSSVMTPRFEFVFADQTILFNVSQRNYNVFITSKRRRDTYRQNKKIRSC